MKQNRAVPCFLQGVSTKLPPVHTVGGTCHPSRNGQVLGPKKPLTGWAMEDLAGAYQRHEDVKLMSKVPA